MLGLLMLVIGKVIISKVIISLVSVSFYIYSNKLACLYSDKKLSLKAGQEPGLLFTIFITNFL
jgi:hypothetical protein